jgi:hypothetical protein
VVAPADRLSLMAGDGRLLERFRSEELLPLGSRMRVRRGLSADHEKTKMPPIDLRLLAGQAAQT